MIKKRCLLSFILITLILLTSSIFLSGCVDYEYQYHFYVKGGHGKIVIAYKGETIATEMDSPLIMRGGKTGTHQLEFMAIPDEGYRVKEWMYLGEVVKDNKSNMLISQQVGPENYIVTVSVEFEPIEQG